MNHNALPDSDSLAFVEQLYQSYQNDPDSVDAAWREYFASLENGDGASTRAAQNGATSNGAAPNDSCAKNGASKNGNGRGAFGPSFQTFSVFNPPSESQNGVANGNAASTRVSHDASDGLASRVEARALQDRVDQLVRAFRVRGHNAARVDPLGLPRISPPEIEPEYYGFTEADMNRLFSSETLAGDDNLTLREMIARLRTTYCRQIGVQFMHIDDLEVRNWLQERMEATQNRIELSRAQQVRILTKLTEAVAFEEFIRRKFVGAKSFSLEGAESLIPLLDMAIEKAGDEGINEIVMGMAHRGRLNVLANIIGKSPREIFREFEDKDADLHVGGGDVKYHLGYVNDWQTSSGKQVHLALCFNPSHLEYVNPVAMGRLRAKQDRAGDLLRERGLCIQIHGDAAFIGEGVVQETLNLSQLPGYTVGGTLHIVVNNQIGFTTSPEYSRSSVYATDIAKMLQIPIFHVNGEDPEAVAQVVNLALDFRRHWKRDVVIDMYCYRKLGHNEADEPSFTQPKMYRAIASRQPVRDSYLEHLLELKGITREEADEIVQKRRAELEEELSEARSDDYHPPARVRTTGDYRGGSEKGVPDCETGVPLPRLQQLLTQLSTIPPDFAANPKVKRVLAARAAMATGTQPLDWSAGEALAFATLATETDGDPVRVRLTGQDSERGTFSQRHAVLHDIDSDETYIPFHHLAENQAPIEIENSPLSENGVLGFEYGYSLDCLGGLILWEAQFGDFWNCAQVIVDQFIASAEDKWQHLSGLVMLLPHGYEGQGPEHSSARLERVLALCAEENIQVVYPTTPAQYFHVLRRQIVRRWRKPLIVMSPKSLLRHLEAVSPLEDLSHGTFQRILPDASTRSDAKGADAKSEGESTPRDPKNVKLILLCSGKIYYELDKKRDDLERDDVAILRFEQLYPLPAHYIEEALSPYAAGVPARWIQEEPENMGALRHLKLRFGNELAGDHPLSYVSREESASPATGSAGSHKQEQEAILQAAFAAA